LRELGHPPVPVATTVHDLQVVDSVPRDTTDQPLSVIATPTHAIRIKRPRAQPDHRRAVFAFVAAETPSNLVAVTANSAAVFFLREWDSVRNGITSLIDPARVAVEEAIAAASGYAELAQEIKAVERRLTDRPQLELFTDLAKQRRVRTLDAVRASLRATDRALTEAKQQGQAAFNAFMARLRAFRVLDPACGSGNFLYLALVEL
jgi:hypothetical protein